MHMAAYALRAGLLLLASSPLFAQVPARPAPPVITVGADLKELIFDWEPVEGAVMYRLMEKVGEGDYFTAVGPRIPATRTRAGHPVAVHLHDWDDTRYLVQACNEAGCTRSNEVSAEHLMLDSIGYVKASNTNAGDRFGKVIALSADGSTMAVSAQREASNASGVNGDQANNSSALSGAVYVFRKTGRRWAQEAYLKAGTNQSGQHFGSGIAPHDHRPLAISADGSQLAVGAPGHNLTPSGDEGVVYLYARAANNTWSLTATLRSPTPTVTDRFGSSVDMSHDGRTLKISSLLPQDEFGRYEGRTHIYVRPDTTWQHSVTLAPHYAGDQCVNSRLSGNGRTLMAICQIPDGYARVVTRRLIDGVWTHENDFSIDLAVDKQPMAISYHGTRLAVNLGYSSDGGPDTATVGMYEWENSTWVLKLRILGPGNYGGPYQGWAQSIEFDKHGDYMAIAHYDAPWDGAGVNQGNIQMGTEPHGAVLVWKRVDDPTQWVRVAVVKAPQPDALDAFGMSVGLSGDGRILAIGATGEDSAARGIDGNQASESAQNSGAVFLY
jgi:trimeric autotransporter adhesin